ncbi:MAG: CHAT domain-containing protein, partial [Planctomycetota bacterium JB042]
MPLSMLTSLLLTLATWSPADEPFVRAIEAVADGRVVAMTKALAEARAADLDAERRATLEEDCVALARLEPSVAAELLERVVTFDVAPPVPEEIRALLVRTLGRRGERLAAEARSDVARSAANAAVELSLRAGDPELEAWARRRRVDAILAADPHPDDGPILEEDLAALRRATDASDRAAHEGIELRAATIAHRQGDDGGAYRRLAPLDAATSEAPLELLSLRLVVGSRLRRFDAAAADAAELERRVEGIADRTARSRARASLATWHRLRPSAAGEAATDPYRRAIEAYTAAAADADSPADRGAAIEWRGAVRSHLDEFEAADADFARARRIFLDAGREFDASRQHMRSAWNAFFAGDTAASLRSLDRFDEAVGRLSLHETGRLGVERNALHLRTRIALADGDLARAETSLASLFAADRRLTEPLGRKDILLASDQRGAIWGSLLGDLLDHGRRRPADRRRGFELSIACAERARVLLLSKVLGGPERPTFGLLPGSLPPIPPGVAELRWARTADDRDGPPRYVLLARHGDRISFRRLEPVEEIDRDVEAFLGRWMTPESLGAPARRYAEDAHDLFTRLFGDAAAWFTGAAPPRRLVVIADGTLERLPLDALVTAPSSADAGFGDLAYLLRTTAVLNVPSLGVLAALPPPNGHAGAVAVLDPIVRGPDGRPLPSLRSTRLERDALVAALDATVLRRDSATLPRLRRALEARNVGWLHVAGHSVEDPGVHDRASLLLTTN